MPKKRTDVCPHCCALKRILSCYHISDSSWNDFKDVLEKNNPSDIFKFIAFELPTSVESQQTPIENQPTYAENQQTAVESQPTAVESQPTVVENQPTAVENQQTAVENQQTAVENQQTAVENQTTSQNFVQKSKVVFLDLETNGFNKPWATSIGAYCDGSSFYRLIYPERDTRIGLNKKAVEINKLYLSILIQDGIDIKTVLQNFMDFVKYGTTDTEKIYVLCHNLSYDMRVLKREFEFAKLKIPDNWEFICTLELCNLNKN
jgi:DNA polymerase III epsilon subunit-like protein